LADPGGTGSAPLRPRFARFSTRIREGLDVTKFSALVIARARAAARLLAVSALLAAASTTPSITKVFADDPAPAAEPAAAAPKSSAGKRWMLDFAHDRLQRVLIDDGTGNETTYMYMKFSVTNKTGLPRDWHPLVTATLDTRRERPYYAGGFPIALERIRKIADDAELQAVETTWSKRLEGKIKDGETKSLVAIFGPVDAGWSTFHIEFHGLVNPLTTLKAYKYSDTAITFSEPVYVERNAQVLAELTKSLGGAELPKPTSEYQVVIEKRVWAVDYTRKGDEFRPDDDPIEFGGERWRVLGEPKLIRKVN
jgi:hypothetical protein